LQKPNWHEKRGKRREQKFARYALAIQQRQHSENNRETASNKFVQQLITLATTISGAIFYALLNVDALAQYNYWLLGSLVLLAVSVFSSLLYTYKADAVYKALADVNFYTMVYPHSEETKEKQKQYPKGLSNLDYWRNSSLITFSFAIVILLIPILDFATNIKGAQNGQDTTTNPKASTQPDP